MIFSISARVSSRDPYINTRSRGDSLDDIEKGYILILLSYTYDKLFYEAN
jgi:hypothetical protein